MGLYFGRCSSGSSSDAPTKNIAPEPEEFEILGTEEINGYLIAIIKYPRCTNFEGIKILLYKGMTEEQLRKYHMIDPHFSNFGLSPLARFMPTREGLEMARRFAKI